MPKVKEVDYRSRHPHQSPSTAQHMFPTCRACGRRYNKLDAAMHEGPLPHNKGKAVGKAGDTRTCPKCRKVVKGNGWHLNKHLRGHA